MTKIAPTVGILVLLALAASAAGAVQFDGLGVKIGATSSHMHSDSSAYGNSEAATGVVVGTFVDLVLSRSMILQPALVFVRRGGTYHDLSSSLTNALVTADELVLRRDYLELPLIFRYNWSLSEAFSLSLNAGPAIGWVLAYEVVEDSEDLTQRIAEDGSLLPQEPGGYDLALVLGAGATRTQWGRKFTLDAMYRIASNGTSSEAVANDFEADGIDVTLGVRF